MAHTLLLADDSVTIQRVIELTFAEEDVDVVAVSDGDQAIKRLESSPPDIVLADIGMPGRDGYEVARYIRQTPKLSHIPVVLLTGAFEPVDQVKAAEVGCDGVLAKPFEPQLVIGRVKELLSGAPRGVARPLAALSSDDAPAVESTTEVAPPAQSLDDYFDRLDSAFANMGGGSTAPPAPPAERATAPVVPEPPAGTSPPDRIDALAALHAPQPSSDPELPLSYATPSPANAPPAPLPLPPAAPAPATQARRELPSVADAFAAILAAEQTESDASSRPVWPTAVASAPTPPAAAEISDEAVDRIVQRVLAQISVRDQVAQIAERLVREEIERIKASIQ